MRSSDDVWLFIVEQALYKRVHPDTKAEEVLIKPLKKLGFFYQIPLMLTGVHGRRHPMIADFYHPEHKVIVEVDGASHRTRKWKDRKRDRAAAWNEIRTIRVTNKEALKGTALDRIKKFLSNGRG